MTYFQLAWSLFFTLIPSIYIGLTQVWWWGVLAFIFIFVAEVIFGWLLFFTMGNSAMGIRPWIKAPILAILAILISRNLTGS